MLYVLCFGFGRRKAVLVPPLQGIGLAFDVMDMNHYMQLFRNDTKRNSPH